MSTICLCVPRPRRRTSSWLKSSSRISDASSTQTSVSSPLGKVTDLSFSASSKPLNITELPLAQVIRKSPSLQVKSSSRPQRVITWRNRAKVESLFVAATARTTRTLQSGSISNRYRYLCTANTLLPDPAPPYSTIYRCSSSSSRGRKRGLKTLRDILTVIVAQLYSYLVAARDLVLVRVVETVLEDKPRARGSVPIIC